VDSPGRAARSGGLARVKDSIHAHHQHPPDVTPSFRFGEQITVGGFRADEVSSSLQKSIRRGNDAESERHAIFWATELDLSGFGNYAFKRLRVIASEDVGPAWPEGPAVIRALYENWQHEKKAAGKDANPGVGMLYLVHAVILLCRAEKSRVVDDACMVFYAGDRAAMGVEVPDYAVDHHTARGRSLGRTEASVYDSSYLITHESETVDNPYHDEARAIDGAPPVRPR